MYVYVSTYVVVYMHTCVVYIYVYILDTHTSIMFYTQIQHILNPNRPSLVPPCKYCYSHSCPAPAVLFTEPAERLQPALDPHAQPGVQHVRLPVARLFQLRLALLRLRLAVAVGGVGRRVAALLPRDDPELVRRRRGDKVVLRRAFEDVPALLSVGVLHYFFFFWFRDGREQLTCHVW